MGQLRGLVFNICGNTMDNMNLQKVVGTLVCARINSIPNPTPCLMAERSNGSVLQSK
jgi:hypothetical protein